MKTTLTDSRDRSETNLSPHLFFSNEQNKTKTSRGSGTCFLLEVFVNSLNDDVSPFAFPPALSRMLSAPARMLCALADTW